MPKENPWTKGVEGIGKEIGDLGQTFFQWNSGASLKGPGFAVGQTSPH